MKTLSLLLSLLLFTTIVTAQRSQVRRDPMTDKEVDQMREYRDQPDKRVRLMVTMIQKRMDELTKIEKDSTGIKPSERGAKTHELLEDITNLVDELDDNIETFLKEEADIRKPLHAVVSTETTLATQLNSIKTSDADKPWFPEFSFQLDDTIEAVNSGVKSAKEAIPDDESVLKAAKERQSAREKAMQPK
jgi:hypothetical protein